MGQAALVVAVGAFFLQLAIGRAEVAEFQAFKDAVDVGDWWQTVFKIRLSGFVVEAQAASELIDLVGAEPVDG